MSVVLTAALGTITGLGMGSAHAYVSAGKWLNAPIGAVGGIIGASVLGPELAEPLAESAAAGAAAGAGIGGMTLVAAVGIGARVFRVAQRRAQNAGTLDERRSPS